MKKFLFYLFNFWPPFLGAGITVTQISDDLLSMRVRLKKRFWTSTLLKAQFGGSIFAMTDPIYAAILTTHLGKEYVVWDHSASIEFLKPGRSELFSDFKLEKQEIDKLKIQLVSERKMIWQKTIQVFDIKNELIAVVTKKIHIRHKNQK